jgi:hypothetical protein
MPDVDRALQTLGGELALEISELALGAPARELSVLEDRYPRRIVASRFSAPTIGAGYRPRPEDTANAAHRRRL